MARIQAIILSRTISYGLTFWGPFENEETAIRYAKGCLGTDDTWEVVLLCKPEAEYLKSSNDLAAQCAHLRTLGQHLINVLRDHEDAVCGVIYFTEKVESGIRQLSYALADNAGIGWMSPEDVNKLRENLMVATDLLIAFKEGSQEKRECIAKGPLLRDFFRNSREVMR